MLRRFCALLLTLACAFAPAVPTRAALPAKADDCCCHRKCACDMPNDCAPAPAAPLRTLQVVTVATEQRVAAARPAPRQLFATFVRLLSASEEASGFARPVCRASAAMAPLFAVHCSRLI